MVQSVSCLMCVHVCMHVCGACACVCPPVHTAGFPWVVTRQLLGGDVEAVSPQLGLSTVTGLTPAPPVELRKIPEPACRALPSPACRAASSHPCSPSDLCLPTSYPHPTPTPGSFPLLVIRGAQPRAILSPLAPHSLACADPSPRGVLGSVASAGEGSPWVWVCLHGCLLVSRKSLGDEPAVDFRLFLPLASSPALAAFSA